ncbi:MAG TPA: DUF1566 domain-containing protein, partial [Thiolinea sp.]|nr:DUF1566 domain-containing protein [Thiolinea sp.]
DQTVDYATNPWSCVKDNVTGLVWEVKTNDNGLRDKDWSFSWYEPNLANGGYVGIASGPGSCDLAGNCNTSAYATRVNTSNLCGFNDWRLPSSQELMGIALIGSTPSIDQNFFPNTDTASPYWTNETFAIANTDAWEVIFSSATSYGGVPKYAPLHVRLVRGQ